MTSRTAILLLLIFLCDDDDNVTSVSHERQEQCNWEVVENGLAAGTETLLLQLLSLLL